MAVSTLEIFNIRKEKVKNLISESIKIYETLGMKTNAEKAEKSLKKVQNDDFKAIVIGEFKRGKSTFINALLGDEILPAFAMPCTAVINEVKYAEKETAVLHFKDPLPENADYSFKEEVKNHINRYGKANIPPLPIDVKDLEDFVVIPDPAKDQKLSISESPYSKVELFYPIEICKNGVTIIDSPGLNEHGTRTKVTTDYLSQVDAIIFVMSCQALCSQSEMEFIENKIRGYGHEEIFFICNRFDEIREREKERVISYAKNKLAHLTSFGEAGIFFVSAADALDGRLDCDQELVEKSGMLPFEENLKDFFANERGKIKLNQPMKELFKDLKDVHDNFIPGQIKMLSQSVADLEKKYEEVKPQLEYAEKKKDQILRQIEIAKSRIRAEIEDSGTAMLKDCANKAQKWTEGHNFETKISGFLNTDEEIEAYKSEINDFLNTRLEKEIDNWNRNFLLPKIEEQRAELINSLGGSLTKFNSELLNIKATLFDEQGKTGENIIQPITSIDWNWTDIIIVTFVGTGLLASLPFFFIDWLIKGHKLPEEIKNEMVSKFASNLKEKAIEQGAEFGKKAIKPIEDFETTMSEYLNGQIKKIRESVESVLKEKKKGEIESRRKTQVLEQVKSVVESKIEDIRELISEINPDMKYSEIKNLQNI